MKLRRVVVETHQPRHRQTELCFWTAAERDQLWIPVFASGVATFDPLLDLQQRVLHMPRVVCVRQIPGDICVGKLAAKPGEVPREKGRNEKQPGEDQYRTSTRRAPAHLDCSHAWMVSVFRHEDKSGKASGKRSRPSLKRKATAAT